MLVTGALQFVLRQLGWHPLVVEKHLGPSWAANARALAAPMPWLAPVARNTRNARVVMVSTDAAHAHATVAIRGLREFGEPRCFRTDPTSRTV